MLMLGYLAFYGSGVGFFGGSAYIQPKCVERSDGYNLRFPCRV